MIKYVPEQLHHDKAHFEMIKAIRALDLTIDEQITCQSMTDLYRSRGYEVVHDTAKFDHAWVSGEWKP